MAQNKSAKKSRCTFFVGQHMQQPLTRYVVGQVITIDVLPDDALLEIFDFYMGRHRDRGFMYEELKKKKDTWQTLVHVCRRWRTLVFGSPLF
jgi:hypothetical protein